MKRVFIAGFLVLVGALTASAQTTFYFPQVADGDQGGGIAWTTTIYLSHPGASGAPTVSGSIVFKLPTGAPFQIGFVNEAGQPVGSGNTVPFQLAPGQTRRFVSTGVPPLAVGFAVVSANGTITGTSVFSQFRNGALLAEAAVPASTAVLKQAIIVDTTGGFDTALAYSNPGVSTPPTELKLLSTEGVQVLSTADTSTVFQTAKFVTQVFSPPPPPMVGTLQISSTAPLAVVALRFAPSGVFTTLPPITLASIIQPALRWMEGKPWLSSFSSFARLLGGLQFRLG